MKNREPRPNVRQLARQAGDQGVSTPPMSNSARALAYRDQRGDGAFCAQLTPAQSKRLRKKMNARDGVETRLHVPSKREHVTMTGAELDRMLAAQRRAYTR